MDNINLEPQAPLLATQAVVSIYSTVYMIVILILIALVVYLYYLYTMYQSRFTYFQSVDGDYENTQVGVGST